MDSRPKSGAERTHAKTLTRNHGFPEYRDSVLECVLSAAFDIATLPHSSVCAVIGSSGLRGGAILLRSPLPSLLMFASMPLSSLWSTNLRSALVRVAVVALALGRLPLHTCAAEPADGVTSTPFATRSGPRGATMFTTLAPGETGIVAENKYADPKMWSTFYREFSLGAVGTGVAIGDYDDDGRADVFVVCKTTNNRLFRNLGNWKFEDVTDRAGVAGPGDAWQQGAAFVDANNDERLDLYVCRFAAPNLLYLNQGDGTFVESGKAAGLDLNDASAMSAWADYDRDGHLDVFVQTNLLNGEARPNGQRDHLYHNNGDGTFTDVSDAAGMRGETQGHAATWWDFNDDGWPDLYLDNDFKDPDQLFRNDGNGRFTHVLSYVVPHIPQSSMGADLGDVDNDGLIDLYVADMAATSFYKDARGMASLRAGALEDWKNPQAAPQYMRNALFLNTGADFCREAAFLTGLAATDWTWSVRFEDLDNDGWLDLHVTNGMVRELHNSDIVNRMLSTENMNARIRIMQSSPRLDEANLAFRNRGNLEFEPVGAAWGLDHHGVSFGAGFGDLDGDGDLDLVFANYDGPPTVCRNDSDTGHRVIIALRGVASNRFGIGSTVRLETTSGSQVRQLVLARGYNSTSEPVVHFGLGEGATITRLVVTWPSGRTQEWRDLAVDRRYVITEPSEPPTSPPARPDHAARLASRVAAAPFVESSRDVDLSAGAAEHLLDESRQQPLLPWRLNPLGPGVAVGDLDGDKLDDVCVGGPMGAPPQLWRLQSSGRFMSDLLFGLDHPTATADAGVVIFDADGDGANDILIAKGGVARPENDPAYQPRLWLNRGGARFTGAPKDALPEVRSSAGPVVAADYNRDGRLDVFLGGRVVPGKYPIAPRSVLLENRGGKFVDVTASVAPEVVNIGLVQAALWTDADGDGWIDLIVALEWGGVRFFHATANAEGQRVFEDWSERAGFAAAGTGFWRSLAAADFNRDGRLDYVAGNGGLNNAYRASPTHPALLFYGAFDGSDRPQIVEAFYEGNELHPRRGRKLLLDAFANLRPKFPTFESFARAKFDDVFPPEAIARAQRFAATNLHSGVFLSQPDGTWQFAPLPRIAQIAPIDGVVAGDFDGDGHADIYGVQNSFAPVPETSRFDGGLSQLIRGNGRGEFVAVPPAASNLIVPGDAQALAVLDVTGNGWPDFLITRNNERSLFYTNRGITGRKSFAVVLRGAKGNPTSIGAQVTVELADGTTQTSEVAAGSGHLSQSSASLFFGYPEQNPPREIRVRWPSGATAVHPWTNWSARVELPEPEA